MTDDDGIVREREPTRTIVETPPRLGVGPDAIERGDVDAHAEQRSRQRVLNNAVNRGGRL